MSAIISSNGANIGSVYEIVGGSFAWCVVVRTPHGVDYRRGRHQNEKIAQQAMLAGAMGMGVDSPVLEIVP